jgi:hypothetical protein
LHSLRHSPVSCVRWAAARISVTAVRSS